MKKSDLRLANAITFTAMAALLIYITLDAIYFHVWFTPENAVVVPLVQSLVVLAGMSLMVYLQRKERQKKPLGAVAERAIGVTPTKAWYLVAFFLGVIGGIMGYIIVKDEDKPMANRLLIMGLSTTLLVASYTLFLNWVVLKSIPVPPI